MLRHEDNNTPEREVNLWLKKNMIPPQRWVSLLRGEKKILHGMLSVPRHQTSYSQMQDLYRKLCLLGIAGREAIDPTEFMPEDKLDSFFQPVKEELSYLEKF